MITFLRIVCISTKVHVQTFVTVIIILDDHYISNLRGSCWYMLNGPVYMIPTYRDIPLYWVCELKFNTSSDEAKPPINKANINNFLWDAIYFVLLINYQLFHTFFNEIDALRSPETSGIK